LRGRARLPSKNEKGRKPGSRLFYKSNAEGAQMGVSSGPKETSNRAETGQERIGARRHGTNLEDGAIFLSGGRGTKKRGKTSSGRNGINGGKNVRPGLPQDGSFTTNFRLLKLRPETRSKPTTLLFSVNQGPNEGKRRRRLAKFLMTSKGQKKGRKGWSSFLKG